MRARSRITMGACLVLLTFASTGLCGEKSNGDEALTEVDWALIDERVAGFEKTVADFRLVLEDKNAPLAEKAKVIKQIDWMVLYYPESTGNLVPGLSALLVNENVGKKTKGGILRIFGRMGGKAAAGTKTVETYMTNELQKHWDRPLALGTLADMDPKNALVEKELPNAMKHENMAIRYLAAIKLLDTGNTSQAVRSLVAEGTGKGRELHSILAIARNVHRLTKEEKEEFIKVLGTPHGNTCKDNLKNYCIHKLKENIEGAVEYYAKALKEKSLLAMAPWRELPNLSKPEIRALSPIIIEHIKQNKKSLQMLSLACLLKDVHAVAAVSQKSQINGETEANARPLKGGPQEVVTDWMRNAVLKKTNVAMARCDATVLVAERDLRLKNGKPIRSGIWGATTFDRQTLPTFINRISGKLAGVNIESSTPISAMDAAGVSKELAKRLPKGGVQVVAAKNKTADCLEFYVNPDGKIVALFGSER